MKKYLPWLATLAILIVGFGTIYGVAQQVQRSAANYPQIQLAQDASAALSRGELASSVVGPRVNIAKSLAPFVIIYDKTGRVLVGSGFLNDKVPRAPLGILKAATGKDYHAITWQPQKDVRIAAVTTATQSGYVLSGRNLKEVEKNESTSLLLTIIGGLVAVALLALVFVLSDVLEEY